MTTTTVIFLLILQLLLDLIAFFLILRLLLILFAEDVYNPFIEFIFKWTAWVTSVKRIIPGYKRFDLATFVLIIFIELCKIFLVYWLNFRKIPLSYSVLTWLIADVLNLFFSVLFYALLLRALLHWFELTRESPLYDLLFMITEPILKPFRKFVPIIKNIDILAIIVALILKTIAIILFVPLLRWSELSTISHVALHSLQWLHFI